MVSPIVIAGSDFNKANAATSGFSVDNPGDPFENKANSFLSPVYVGKETESFYQSINRLPDYFKEFPDAKNVKDTVEKLYQQILTNDYTYGRSFPLIVGDGLGLPIPDFGINPSAKDILDSSAFFQQFVKSPRDESAGSLFSGFPNATGIMFDGISYGNAIINRSSEYNRPIAWQDLGNGSFAPFNPDNPDTFNAPVVGLPEHFTNIFPYGGGNNPLGQPFTPPATNSAAQPNTPLTNIGGTSIPTSAILASGQTNDGQRYIVIDPRVIANNPTPVASTSPTMTTASLAPQANPLAGLSGSSSQQLSQIMAAFQLEAQRAKVEMAMISAASAQNMNPANSLSFSQPLSQTLSQSFSQSNSASFSNGQWSGQTPGMNNSLMSSLLSSMPGNRPPDSSLANSNIMNGSNATANSGPNSQPIIILLDSNLSTTLSNSPSNNAFAGSGSIPSSPDMTWGAGSGSGSASPSSNSGSGSGQRPFLFAGEGFDYFPDVDKSAKVSEQVQLKFLAERTSELFPDFVPTNVSGGTPAFLTRFPHEQPNLKNYYREQWANPTTVNTSLLSAAGVSNSGGTYGKGIAVNPFFDPNLLQDTDPFSRFNSGIVVADGNQNGKMRGTPLADSLFGLNDMPNIINGRGGGDALFGGNAQDLVNVMQGDWAETKAGNDLLYFDFGFQGSNDASHTTINGGGNTDTLVITLGEDPSKAESLPTIQPQADGSFILTQGNKTLVVRNVEHILFTDVQGNIGTVYR